MADPAYGPDQIAADLPEDLPLCPLSLDGLAIYLDQLIRCNKAMNLVGKSEPSEILRDLVCDSFHLAYFLGGLYPPGSEPVIWEPGAGAGLPGIPLRMVWQAGDYTMIEIREKRALFLDNVLARLKLPSARVFRGSLEKLHAAAGAADLPDCILSRAFRPWPDLVKLCKPMLKPGGYLVIMANAAPPEQVSWQLSAACSYSSGASRRWLWALTTSCGD